MNISADNHIFIAGYFIAILLKKICNLPLYMIHAEYNQERKKHTFLLNASAITLISPICPINSSGSINLMVSGPLFNNRREDYESCS
jgi:hypothetical protein